MLATNNHTVANTRRPQRARMPPANGVQPTLAANRKGKRFGLFKLRRASSPSGWADLPNGGLPLRSLATCAALAGSCDSVTDHGRSPLGSTSEYSKSKRSTPAPIWTSTPTIATAPISFLRHPIKPSSKRPAAGATSSGSVCTWYREPQHQSPPHHGVIPTTSVFRTNRTSPNNPMARTLARPTLAARAQSPRATAGLKRSTLLPGASHGPRIPAATFGVCQSPERLT